MILAELIKFDNHRTTLERLPIITWEAIAILSLPELEGLYGMGLLKATAEFPLHRGEIATLLQDLSRVRSLRPSQGLPQNETWCELVRMHEQLVCMS